MSSESLAEQRQAATISSHECRAIRQLDADDGYSRSEIAFIFECGAATIARHADHDCQHPRWRLSAPGISQYSDEDLLAAVRIVSERQTECRVLSQTTYDDWRPEAFPTAECIRRRFGGWPEARMAALEVDR